jgi:hypothetical protein
MLSEKNQALDSVMSLQVSQKRMSQQFVLYDEKNAVYFIFYHFLLVLE